MTEEAVMIMTEPMTEEAVIIMTKLTPKTE